MTIGRVGRDLLHPSLSPSPLLPSSPVLAGRVLRERVCTSFPTGFPCRQYKNGALGSACFYLQLFVLSAYAPAESYCSAYLSPLPTSTVYTTVSGSSKRSDDFARAICNANNCLRALPNKAGAGCTNATRIPKYAAASSSATRFLSAFPVSLIPLFKYFNRLICPIDQWSRAARADRVVHRYISNPGLS